MSPDTVWNNLKTLKNIGVKVGPISQFCQRENDRQDKKYIINVSFYDALSKI